MIAAMFSFDEEAKSVLVVVIETDNLERMKTADPITLESISEGGALAPPRYPLNFSILIAYEPDREELYRLAKISPPMELLRWLERGRKFIEGVDGIVHAHRIRSQS
jgi:hypothetical protein